MKKDYGRKLFSFYAEQLFSSIMPFWLNKGIDFESGGYLTCMDDKTGELRGTDKFTWSQGRLVWVFSRLAGWRLPGVSEQERKSYLNLARSGADFILRNCVMENGSCVFLTDRKGRPKEMQPGTGYDSSIYADIFAVIGLSEFARVAGENKYLSEALRIYESMLSRLENGCYRTDPYPVPPGYRFHGTSMSMLHVSDTLLRALDTAGRPEKEKILKNAENFLAETLSFASGGKIFEFVRKDASPDGTMLGNYINPGHTLEDAWFILHFSVNCLSRRKELVEKTAVMTRTAYKTGKDPVHGGIFLFAHKGGGPPAGARLGGTAAVMEEKLLSMWDYKLWWVHSEALYVSLLLYSLTGDEFFKSMHDETKDYAFSAFPDINKLGGEWIQTRDRTGNPVEAVVALPVKDPFHTARSLILMLELLAK